MLVINVGASLLKADGFDRRVTSGGRARRPWLNSWVDSAKTLTTVYLSEPHFEKEVNTQTGLTEFKHYVKVGGSIVAIQTRRSDGTEDVKYLIPDHLGSTSLVTDSLGAVVDRQAFDPWGDRRVASGSTVGAADPANLIQPTSTTRGYTGHEQLDQGNMGLTHMNGRVYDPTLGRFISADPNVPAPFSSQSFNRFSYVRNSPLNATDPTGYLDTFSQMAVANVSFGFVSIIVLNSSSSGPPPPEATAKKAEAEMMRPVQLAQVSTGTFTDAAAAGTLEHVVITEKMDYGYTGRPESNAPSLTLKALRLRTLERGAAMLRGTSEAKAPSVGMGTKLKAWTISNMPGLAGAFWNSDQELSILSESMKGEGQAAASLGAISAAAGGAPDPNDPNGKGDGLTRAQRQAIKKVDNVINNNALPHDFEGVENELAGRVTGFDHVTEMRQSVRALQDAAKSLDGSLQNPNLNGAAREQISQALSRANSTLARMTSTLGGY